MTDWLSLDSSTLDQAVENAARLFDEKRSKLADHRQFMAESTHTVQAKNKTLSMTFDGHGELTSMKFLDTRFRSMAPAELAHLIVETLRTGRAQCLDKISENIGSSLPGLDIAGLISGKSDPGTVFETLLNGMLGDGMGELPGGSTQEGR